MISNSDDERGQLLDSREEVDFMVLYYKHRDKDDLLSKIQEKAS